MAREPTIGAERGLDWRGGSGSATDAHGGRRRKVCLEQHSARGVQGPERWRQSETEERGGTGLSAVVANRLDRATFHGLLTLAFLFVVFRLLEDE